jgi:hypothetical protein
MANMFTKAKVAAKPAKPSKVKDKPEVVVNGLADLAAVDALMKSLAAIKETLEADVKAQTLAHFKTQVAQTKKIENFRGVDDGASASCEFRKRSSASALNEAELDLLNRFKVPTGEKVIVEECFRVNPKYTGDSVLLEKISKAISKVKDVPEDFIELQEGVTKTVVTEETIATACKDSAVFDAVATVIGTLALKPKLDETDTAEIIETVKALIS